MDTIIILLKGRRSSLLQTYHHAGAIITMYMGYNYRAHPIWIFTTFNSFVHTIMYAYYGKTLLFDDYISIEEQPNVAIAL